jgi:hypothetical protein
VDVTFTPGGLGGANLVIRSKFDCLPTIQAVNANDHVIDIQTGGVGIHGLRVSGASANGMCGIMSRSWGCSIHNCILFGNDIAFDNSGNPGTSFNNNTCYGPNGLYVGGGGSCQVINNIVWATAVNGWAHREYPTPAMSCDYNLYWAPNGHVGYDGTNFYTTLAAWQAHSFNDGNGQYGDPNLANVGGGDFHLTASSALAIDQGTTSWNSHTDAEGYARGHGTAWDIGAFERN